MRSRKNEEQKREKVTWEVTEFSRKGQNGQVKNLQKKDQHVYNNCYNFVREQLINNQSTQTGSNKNNHSFASLKIKMQQTFNMRKPTMSNVATIVLPKNTTRCPQIYGIYKLSPQKNKQREKNCAALQKLKWKKQVSCFDFSNFIYQLFFVKKCSNIVLTTFYIVLEEIQNMVNNKATEVRKT